MILCRVTGDVVSTVKSPKLAGHHVRASAVLPVRWRSRLLGVVLLRKASPGAQQVAGKGVDYARIVLWATARGVALEC